MTTINLEAAVAIKLLQCPPFLIGNLSYFPEKREFCQEGSIISMIVHNKRNKLLLLRTLQDIRLKRTIDPNAFSCIECVISIKFKSLTKLVKIPTRWYPANPVFKRFVLFAKVNLDS